MPAIIPIAAGIAAGAGAGAIGATVTTAIVVGAATAIGAGVLQSQTARAESRAAGAVAETSQAGITAMQIQAETDEELAMLQAETAKSETEAGRILTEKQMVLSSQRSQIETLATLLQTQQALHSQPIVPTQLFTPQVVRTQTTGFLGRINSFIDNLFR